MIANKTFTDGLVAWLGDAANGIGKLFVREVHTDILCVGATCVNEAQLQQLLLENQVDSTPTLDPVVSDPVTPAGEVPVTDPVPDTTPVPDPVIDSGEPQIVPDVIPDPIPAV